MDIKTVLKTAKHIHFIGIGGAGMAPLAEILLKRGYTISGSDNNESETLNRIKNLGIPVFMGHSKNNLKGAEAVVHTAALLPDNIELLAAKEMGLPVFERSKLFGAISAEFSKSIGISGTHGKTSVTSMLVQILVLAGLEPNAVIGGKLPLLNSNAAVGDSDLFVCEACEFANTFLELSLSCSVILNIDEDHLDYFKTMENLQKAFTDFAALARDTIIYNADDERTKIALENLKDNKMGKDFISFGLSDGCDWQAKNIGVHEGAYPCFDLYHKGKKAAQITLAVPGRHNVYNALAAIASAVYAGASIEQCTEGLKTFRGAGRRFEILAKVNDITIADDYAHHPAELEVTLEAAKSLGYKRVIAVFQPFTYSRTYTLMNDFARVLKMADIVIMSEIMGAREVNTLGVYTSQLAAKIPNSRWFETFDEIAEHTLSIAKEGDIIITLGCGDIYKAANIMVKIINENAKM